MGYLCKGDFLFREIRFPFVESDINFFRIPGMGVFFSAEVQLIACFKNDISDQDGTARGELGGQLLNDSGLCRIRYVMKGVCADNIVEFEAGYLFRNSFREIMTQQYSLRHFLFGNRRHSLREIDSADLASVVVQLFC